MVPQYGLSCSDTVYRNGLVADGDVVDAEVGGGHEGKEWAYLRSDALLQLLPPSPSRIALLRSPSSQVPFFKPHAIQPVFHLKGSLIHHPLGPSIAGNPLRLQEQHRKILSAVSAAALHFSLDLHRRTQLHSLVCVFARAFLRLHSTTLGEFEVLVIDGKGGASYAENVFAGRPR